MDRRTFMGGMALSTLGAWSARCGAAAEAKPAVAWGQPRDGLQAGLLYETAGTSYKVGERLAFQLRLKNVGDQPVTLSLRKTAHWYASLTADHAVRLHPLPRDVETLTLQPGEERNVPGDSGTFLLQHWDGAGSAPEPLIRLAPGTYRIECPMGLWVADREDPNRATGLRAGPGTLSLEVKLEGQSALPPPGPQAEKGENAVWGKPVNGVQIGLRFQGGQSRFKVGDAAVAELLVRNVSGRPLSFSMLKSATGWIGNFPSIQNEKGEHQRLKLLYLRGARPLTPLSLKHEETVVLGYPTFTVQNPEDQSEATVVPAFAAAPGKYRMKQYESCRPDGSTWFDLLLESGALEFEIAPA